MSQGPRYLGPRRGQHIAHSTFATLWSREEVLAGQFLQQGTHHNTLQLYKSLGSGRFAKRVHGNRWNVRPPEGQRASQGEGQATRWTEGRRPQGPAGPAEHRDKGMALRRLQGLRFRDLCEGQDSEFQRRRHFHSTNQSVRASGAFSVSALGRRARRVLQPRAHPGPLPTALAFSLSCPLSVCLPLTASRRV